MKNDSNRTRSNPYTACSHTENIEGTGCASLILDWWERHGSNFVIILTQSQRDTVRNLFRGGRHAHDRRNQVNDPSFNMKKIHLCDDTGRAQDEQIKRNQGYRIETGLVKTEAGIEITLHYVSVIGENGYPFHVMSKKDEKGVYVMTEKGEHVKVAASMTITRVFPQDRLAELYAKSDVAESLVFTRKIELNLKFSGRDEELGELRLFTDSYDPEFEQMVASQGKTEELEKQRRKLAAFIKDVKKPNRNNAKPTKPVETVSTSKGSQGAGKQVVQNQKKGKIALAKIPAASPVETADDRTDALARELVLAATGYDPDVAGAVPAAEVSDPAPKTQTVREAAGQTKSVRQSMRSVRSFKDLDMLIDKNGPKGYCS